MTLRSRIVYWALRLYWPPFTWFFRLYYWLAILFSRILVSRIDGVQSIYLTGSWLRQDLIYSLSDIDFKVMVAGTKSEETYRSIRQCFAFLRIFFPMLGSPDEKGVYFLDSFDADYRHYPLVQHLFDSRFFRHRLIWGKDLLATLSIKPWNELDQDECAFGRLRDWVERIHLLADYDRLGEPQKQHLYFKAISDVALLAIRVESPDSVFSRRTEILAHVCADIQESHRHLIDNLIRENQNLYRSRLNSDDEDFNLFKKMVAYCSERISRRDKTHASSITIDTASISCGNGNQEIADALKSFSSKIRKVDAVPWPQLPLNPFDFELFNTPAYLVECSAPLSLNEFHSLKAYYRKNLKNRAQVLLCEDPAFLCSVDSILVDHWGSFPGSSDLMHLLLGKQSHQALTLLSRDRIIKRLQSFQEQLAATMTHPEYGRIDLGVFAAYVFNVLRVLIFNHEFSLGRWQWLLTPGDIVNYLASHTPLQTSFLSRLAGQYEKAMRSGGEFDELLLPKTRALLAEMLDISANVGTWASLEKIDSMDDEQHLTISIAIVTRNRPAQLERCLHSIDQLSIRPEEILVVDDGESGSAQPVVEKMRAAFSIRYLRCNQCGVAPARNLAARAAKGEVIAFIDDDASVSPDWLEHVERAFLRDPQIGLVSGASLNMNCGRDDSVWRFMEILEKL